jgi:hypothetical protein
MEAFLNMKNVQSEMDAKRKSSRCKVPPMPMELSGYCFRRQWMLVSVFHMFRSMC